MSVFYQAHQSVEKITVHHRIRTAEVSHLLFKIVLIIKEGLFLSKKTLYDLRNEKQLA